MMYGRYIASCVFLGVISLPAFVVGQCGGSNLGRVVSSMSDSLSTFETLAEGSGLLSELSDSPVPVHVFAPNDAAWKPLLNGFGLTVDELASEKDLVAALLSLHVVVDPEYLCRPATGSNLETLLDQRGQTLSVTPSTVTDPSGVKANILEVISVKNGQLYIVDSVLSPKTS
jgi:uncharacterized surface protein with fasciclin (FAS1) repeats